MKDWQRPNLKGHIILVAGATRGAGRAIAVELGACGATVYCTGRSTRAGASDLGRAETIEETAERVTAAGGVGIAVKVDHTREEEVQALFERIKDEQDGRLDGLINDVWGGDPLTEWGKPFWELELGKARLMQERAVLSHLITARYGVPLMVARGRGLVIEITDGDSPKYRGNLPYDLAKASAIRLAFGMAEELRPHGITALAVTPGFLRSEAMLEGFGVTEETWRDAIQKDPYFAESETPHYVGRAIASLVGDPNVMHKSGNVYASWTLMHEYGFRDIDGRQPDWGAFYRRMQEIQSPETVG